MLDQPTPKQIVWDYVSERMPSDEEWEDLFGNMYDFFSEDQIVDWFVNWLQGDETEIEAALGEKNARIVLDHYEDHCR